MASVLIVDDHPDSCEAVQRALSRRGHRVACVPNGREALAELSTHSPDVVLVDLMMPVMDGITFLGIIRSYLRWADLPVILFTAYPDSLHVDRACALNVAHVFRKADVDLARLLNEIDRLVPPKGQPSSN
jgi:chemosensory pili system protein ChpA (sensor histidine kinase/response regulator)